MCVNSSIIDWIALIATYGNRQFPSIDKYFFYHIMFFICGKSFFPARFSIFFYFVAFFPHIATPSGSIIHIHFDAVACEVFFLLFSGSNFFSRKVNEEEEMYVMFRVLMFFLCCDAAKLNIEEIKCDKLMDLRVNLGNRIKDLIIIWRDLILKI